MSANATRYEWDFCQGDLSIAPSVVTTASNLNGSVTTGVEIVFDGSNWFGFIANQGGNSILRLEFGSDLSATPVVTNLGNISGVTNSPTDIKVVTDNGNWYGFVYGLNSPMISRIDFGSTLNNMPTATALVSGSGSTNGGFDMIRDGGGWAIVSAYFNTLKVIRLAGIESIPTVSDILDLTPFGSSIGDVVLGKENGIYYAYAVDFGNNALYKATFGSTLFTVPVVNNMNVSALGGVSPFGLDAGYDNLNHYLFVSTIQGNVIRINLGQDLLATSATGIPLGNFGRLENTLKIKLVKHESRWFAFAPSWSSTQLYRITFTEPACEISPTSSPLETPEITYSLSGDKAISLRAFAASGEFDETTVRLPVSNSQAPQLSINHANYCIASPVQFGAVSTLPLTSYSWDFGDLGSSTQSTPMHTYGVTGDYRVVLRVTASNGCQNSAGKDITIYPVPVANFTAPSPTLTCTEQPYGFVNTSSFAPGSNLQWQWFIDNVVASTTQNPNLSFPTTGNHDVKLIASIPGCASEINKPFSIQATGSRIDFTVSGQCEDLPVTFTNTTTGPVDNFSWDFADSQTSTATNPTNTFANPGVYDVVLTASNAAGCNNSVSRSLTIYSAPQVNFAALAPPFSCSGTTTQFNDLTPPPADSNLSSWLWNFGDAGSPSNTSTQKNAQHTYATASDYSVSLTVTTNFSCSTTLQKTVTIYQTPVVSFTHSPLCEDSNVTFSDATSGHIAWNWQVGSNFYTTENATHVFANPGTYTVTLGATAANNCIGTATQQITISPKLAVDFTVARACINQETEFNTITNDSTDPITGVQWNFGGLGNATTDAATFRFTDAATTNVTLTVATSSGCQYPVTKAIVVTSGPLAAFTADPNVGEAPVLVQFTNTSLNAATYAWAFGDALQSTSTAASPSFTYTTSGDYIVSLVTTDANNCVDTTRQLIQAVQPLEVGPPSPNPGTGKFIFGWNSGKAAKTQITLTDATGRQIRQFDVDSEAGINRHVLDITGEPPGLYFLTISYLNTRKTYRVMLAE